MLMHKPRKRHLKSLGKKGFGSLTLTRYAEGKLCREKANEIVQLYGRITTDKSYLEIPRIGRSGNL